MSAVVGGAVLSTSACSTAEPDKPSSPAALPENALVTLGVQAGPPPVPNRTGISSTIKVGSDVYQIDCGLGSLNAFTNAGFKFDDLKSMFITHLHTDHMVDYWSFFLSGGYTASKGKAAVMVYGPGAAGGLPPSRVGNADPATIDAADSDAGVGRRHHGAAAGLRLHQQHLHSRYGHRRHRAPDRCRRDRGSAGIQLPRQGTEDRRRSP